MTAEDADILDAVEIDPPRSPRWSVILLHGLGADGYDLAPIVSELGIPPELCVRFVLPHAPPIPVTLNGGMVMPAWYDISEVDLRRRHDEVGIRASATRVDALLRREAAAGVPYDHIVLAGFSQGGAIALHVGLRCSERLAGILALSTYLVCEESLATERSAVNHDVPIFQAHGTLDPMVPMDRGQAAHDRLVQLGYGVEWHTYAVGHGVCPDEIGAMGRWLCGLME